MIALLVEAIDKITGRLVKIEEAYPGQRLTCPHCGVDMHPVLEVQNPFFRRNEGGKHSHYLCEQMERTNRAYDPKLTDIEDLFANLFRPVAERKAPVLPPDTEADPEDEPEVGGSGAESEKEIGRSGDEQVDTWPKDDPDDDVDDDPPEPVILPCRSLSQLWKAGINKFGSSERIGSSLRSDIFLWYKDFDRFFAPHEDLGKRVLAVRPLWPVNRANPLRCRSKWNQ